MALFIGLILILSLSLIMKIKLKILYQYDLTLQIENCLKLLLLDFECHPDQISQVLINLISNAQDAVLDLTERWIEFSVEVNSLSNYLVFNIRDSGMPISEKISEKIFDSFYTTKDIGKGSGLGLSISKAIMANHHGEIYLDKNDEHTHFVFKLPLRQKERAWIAA